MKAKIINLAILYLFGVCSASKALSVEYVNPSFDLQCIAVHGDKVAWCNNRTLFVSTVDTFPSYTKYETDEVNGCDDLRWSDDGQLLYVITSRQLFRVRYSCGRLIKDPSIENREINESLLPEDDRDGKWSDSISLFNIQMQNVVDVSSNERLVALVNGREQIVLFDRSKKAAPKILTMPGIGYEERVPKDYVHQVQVGETLNSIARYYSVSARDLTRLNHLGNPDLIKVHTSLILPSSATINRCTKIHEIQPGETLFSIAKKYETSVESLVILNDIEDPDLIISHTPLVLPEAAKTENYVKIHKMKGYRDCLTSVARSHGVSVKSIILLNNIKTPDRLYYGDLLILPQSAKTDGCEYCTIKRNNLEQ